MAGCHVHVESHAIVTISAAEVEFSLFETAITRNGVASTCADLDIPIGAYSLFAYGLLFGKTTGSPNKENARRNSEHVPLTTDDLGRIDNVLRESDVVGETRYPGMSEYLEG